jgi:hypothetical protein
VEKDRIKQQKKLRDRLQRAAGLPNDVLSKLEKWNSTMDEYYYAHHPR